MDERQPGLDGGPGREREELAAAVLALFVAWDVILCGGRRCRGFMD